MYIHVTKEAGGVRAHSVTNIPQDITKTTLASVDDAFYVQLNILPFLFVSVVPSDA